MLPYVLTPPQRRMRDGAWLRTLQAAYGYSSEDLARICNVRRVGRVERWERKGQFPKGKKRRRILNKYAKDAGLPRR